MDGSIYISLTARSQDRIGLHLRIYGSRPMSVRDGTVENTVFKTRIPTRGAFICILVWMCHSSTEKSGKYET